MTFPLGNACIPLACCGPGRHRWDLQTTNPVRLARRKARLGHGVRVRPCPFRAIQEQTAPWFFYPLSANRCLHIDLAISSRKFLLNGVVKICFWSRLCSLRARTAGGCPQKSMSLPSCVSVTSIFFSFERQSCTRRDRAGPSVDSLHKMLQWPELS